MSQGQLAFRDSVGDEDVVIAGVKVGNVTKMKLNRLLLENVQLRGEKRMEEIKIGQVRFRHKCRRKREIRLLQSDLNAFLNRSEAQENSVIDTNIETALGNEDGFNFRKEFRDVWRSDWR